MLLSSPPCRATLPQTDRPEAFGQHPNADISYQMEDSMVVLDSLVGLQPRTGGGAGGASRDEAVLKVAQDLIDQVPHEVDVEAVKVRATTGPGALDAAATECARRGMHFRSITSGDVAALGARLMKPWHNAAVGSHDHAFA